MFGLERTFEIWTKWFERLKSKINQFQTGLEPVLNKKIQCHTGLVFENTTYLRTNETKKHPKTEQNPFQTGFVFKIWRQTSLESVLFGFLTQGPNRNGHFCSVVKLHFLSEIRTKSELFDNQVKISSAEIWMFRFWHSTVQINFWRTFC